MVYVHCPVLAIHRVQQETGFFTKSKDAVSIRPPFVTIKGYNPFMPISAPDTGINIPI